MSTVAKRYAVKRTALGVMWLVLGVAFLAGVWYGYAHTNPVEWLQVGVSAAGAAFALIIATIYLWPIR